MPEPCRGGGQQDDDQSSGTYLDKQVLQGEKAFPLGARVVDLINVGREAAGHGKRTDLLTFVVQTAHRRRDERVRNPAHEGKPVANPDKSSAFRRSNEGYQ